MNDMIESEPIEAEIVSLDAISPLTRAEIDVQISTAKKYPRSIRSFQQEAKSMACLDEETASACLFALPRGGKSIEGPSVRLAEIVASAWGNLRVGARVVEEGEKFLTAQGFCHDMERNVAVTMEVRRRITDKKGRRYNDDMIVMTGNAAASIAFRNAVFKSVPKAYWNHVYNAARETAMGKIETLAKRRGLALEFLAKMGVPQDRVLGMLERKSIEDVGLEDLVRLKGVLTAIKDGSVNVDDAFPEAGKSAAERVQEKLNGHDKSHTNGSGTAPAGAEPKQTTATEAPRPTQSTAVESAALADGEVPKETEDMEAMVKRFIDRIAAAKEPSEFYALHDEIGLLHEESRLSKSSTMDLQRRCTGRFETLKKSNSKKLPPSASQS